MRYKIIACLAIALLLLSVLPASASLVSLAFPVIRPVYTSDSGDMGKFMGTIDGLVDFSDSQIASLGANSSNVSLPPGFDYPVTTVPGPDMLVSALAPKIPSDAIARQNINKTLVGMNLTYSNIAGKPMNYTITQNDIRSVQKYAYQGKPAWKVRVGEGLAWDLIMDVNGAKILKTDQLFRT
jgi:hypothetical protein